MVCGDWFVYLTISVFNNPITCTARILARAFRAYVYSNVIRTVILTWGPFGRWAPGRVRLPAQQRIMLDESQGST